MDLFSMILSLLCGVALFLYGMQLMGDGLKSVAGNKLETLLYSLTNTPLKGILLGTGVTSVIQSSSATSVMVIGFVNSGMMQLAQAIAIVFGANIGTSVTGWILCLSYIEGGGGIAMCFPLRPSALWWPLRVFSYACWPSGLCIRISETS